MSSQRVSPMAIQGKKFLQEKKYEEAIEMFSNDLQSL
jgi:hypothetical protein